jgi:hypothetical protein
MTAIQKEADELIHLMRQSKMDAIRDYLEKAIKNRDKGKSTEAGTFIIQFRHMFKNTSNNAPLP